LAVAYAVKGDSQNAENLATQILQHITEKEEQYSEQTIRFIKIELLPILGQTEQALAILSANLNEQIPLQFLVPNQPPLFQTLLQSNLAYQRLLKNQQLELSRQQEELLKLFNQDPNMQALLESTAKL
jgi:CRISPR/Cas system-associated endonuclease Cas1